MKTIQKLLLIIVLLATTSHLFAQSNGFTEIIKTGTGDATKLTQAYLSPLFKGIGMGLNSGWYQSAKAKNLGKFDIKFMATTALVPSEDRMFDVRNIGLSSQTQLAPNQNDYNSPTAFGSGKRGPKMDLKDKDGTKIGSFTLPNGSGLNIVPTPQLQLTVGVIKNTDISIRYTPKIGNNSYGRFSVLGFGAKHELTSLIFPGKVGKLVPIDIALAFSYSQVKFERLIAIADQLDESKSGKNLNQRVEGKFSGISADVIVSKKLAAFTPFVSLSYNTSKTDIGVKGDFIVANPLTPAQPYSTITNPVSLQQTDLAALRGNIGFQIQLAFFRLYSTYSISKYQAVTAGIGFGIGQ
jgi:hypothetical protein